MELTVTISTDHVLVTAHQGGGENCVLKVAYIFVALKNDHGHSRV